MAKAGDLITDFVTAAWYNQVTNNLKKTTGIEFKENLNQNQYVRVYNHEEVAKPIWSAVSLGTAKVDYAVAIDQRHSEIGFTTVSFNSTDPHNLAILQEPLPPEIGSSALALVAGSSWLHMPVAATIDPAVPSFVRISSSNVLEYGDLGRIEVIRDFDIGDGYLCVAIIGKMGGGGGITDLRLDGVNFQYYKDGEWTTWHTGTSC